MGLTELKLGDEVAIEIIESLGDHNYVISIDGDLMRTKCLLNKTPQIGEIISATVTAVKPLAFKQVVYSDLHLDLKA